MRLLDGLRGIDFSGIGDDGSSLPVAEFGTPQNPVMPTAVLTSPDTYPIFGTSATQDAQVTANSGWLWDMTNNGMNEPIPGSGVSTSSLAPQSDLDAILLEEQAYNKKYGAVKANSPGGGNPIGQTVWGAAYNDIVNLVSPASGNKQSATPNFATGFVTGAITGGEDALTYAVNVITGQNQANNNGNQGSGNKSANIQKQANQVNTGNSGNRNQGNTGNQNQPSTFAKDFNTALTSLNQFATGIIGTITQAKQAGRAQPAGAHAPAGNPGSKGAAGKTGSSTDALLGIGLVPIVLGVAGVGLLVYFLSKD